MLSRLHPTYSYCQTLAAHRLPAACLAPSGLCLLLPLSYDAPPRLSPYLRNRRELTLRKICHFSCSHFTGTAALPRLSRGEDRLRAHARGPGFGSLYLRPPISYPSHGTVSIEHHLPGRPWGNREGAKKQGYGWCWYSSHFTDTQTHRVCGLFSEYPLKLMGVA